MFKSGQLVRCIDNTDLPEGFYPIVLGEIYEVIDSTKSNVDLKGVKNGYRPIRFVAVDANYNSVKDLL